MNLLDAARRAARHYPGGVEAIAHRLGKCASTLNKELAGAASFKLSAVDALEITHLCQSVGSEHALDYANALADSVGAQLVLLPTPDTADGHTVQDVADLMRECADVVQVVMEADADRAITANELKRIEDQWADVLLAGQTLLAHLRARHEAAVAARVRSLPTSSKRSAA